MQLWIGQLVPTLFAAMLTAPALVGTPLVDYRAAASCPAREVFELELSRRLSTTGNFTGSLSIVIEQVDGSYLGRATWKNQVGASAERSVRHEHCEKLVGALALIGALLLEQEPAPLETTKIVSPEEPAATPTPTAPPKAIAPLRAPAAWVTVVPREFKIARPGSPAPHRQRTLASWFWGPSVGLTGDGLFAPTFRVAPRLGEVLTWRSTPRSSEFAIKVTAARLTSGTFDTAQGSASIIWSSLRLDACYGREAYQGLTFGPCAWFDIGILTATSEGAGVSHQGGTVWSRVGGGLQGRQTFADWLAIDVRVGGVVATRRPRFYLSGNAGAPDQTIHQVSIVGLVADIGLELHF